MIEVTKANKLNELEALFKQLKLSAIKYQHPPLHTCQDADEINLNRAGVRIKNLFLRDNYGKRHFLLFPLLVILSLFFGEKNHQ